ncbi:TIR domain-containing protein [Limibacter armeniacum]|uniref:TIR domain-containing protein n=1 Tax=Limibacter armeniacum TaxID=466084 RepID=UPI002FE639E7
MQISKNSFSLSKGMFISYGKNESLLLAARLHQYFTLLQDETYSGAWFEPVNRPADITFSEWSHESIASAQNFVFIISPDALRTPECIEVLAYAIKLGKRIVPVLHINPTEDDWNALVEECKRDGKTHQATLFGEAIDFLRNHSQWVDAEEEVDTEALAKWLANYENQWEQHQDLAYLRQWEAPSSVNLSEKVLKQLQQIFQSGADLVNMHTEILKQGLEWLAFDKEETYLLAGNVQVDDWVEKVRDWQGEYCCTLSDLHIEYINASKKYMNGNRADLFVCYANNDLKEMREVQRYLQTHLLTTWTDVDDIGKGTVYKEEILKGIENARTILLLLTSSSLKSKYCQEEVEYAASLGKKIFTYPIEDISVVSLPNWLDQLQQTLLESTDELLLKLKGLKAPEAINDTEQGTGSHSGRKFEEQAQENEILINESDKSLITMAEKDQKTNKKLKGLLVASSVLMFAATSGCLYTWLQKENAEKGLLAAEEAKNAAVQQKLKAEQALLVAENAQKEAENAKSEAERLFAIAEQEKQLALNKAQKAQRDKNAALYQKEQVQAEVASLTELLQKAKEQVEEKKEEAIVAQEVVDNKTLDAEAAAKEAMVNQLLYLHHQALVDAQDHTKAMRIAEAAYFMGSDVKGVEAAVLESAKSIYAQQPFRKASFKQHRKAVSQVLISPDGSEVLSLDKDGVAVRWNFNGVLQAELAYTGENIRQVMWSPDSEKILMELEGENRRTRVIMVLRDGQLYGAYQGTWPAAFSKDGKYLVMANDKSGGSYCYNLKESKSTKLKHAGNPISFNFSESGNQLEILLEKEIRVWDLNSNELVSKESVHRKTAGKKDPIAEKVDVLLRRGSWNAGEQYMSATIEEAALKEKLSNWKNKSGKKNAFFMQLDKLEPYDHFVLSTDRKRLMAWNNEHLVVVDDKEREWHLPYKVQSAALSVDGTKLLTNQSGNQQIALWDLENGTVGDLLSEGIEHIYRSPSGKFTLAVNKEFQIKGFDFEGNALFASDLNRFERVLFSSDEQWAMFAEGDTEAANKSQVMNLETGKVMPYVAEEHGALKFKLPEAYTDIVIEREYNMLKIFEQKKEVAFLEFSIPVYEAALTPNRDYLMVCTDAGLLYRYPFSKQSVIMSLQDKSIEELQ